MVHPFVSGLIDVLFRSKGNGITNFFGTLINQGAFISPKRDTVGIAFDEVLIDLGADHFEKVAKMTEHGEVSQNRMLRLQHVVDAKQQDRNQRESQPANRRVEISRDRKREHGTKGKHNKKWTHVIVSVEVAI